MTTEVAEDPAKSFTAINEAQFDRVILDEQPARGEVGQPGRSKVRSNYPNLYNRVGDRGHKNDECCSCCFERNPDTCCGFFCDALSWCTMGFAEAFVEILTCTCQD